MEICGSLTRVNGHWQEPGDPESPRGGQPGTGF